MVTDSRGHQVPAGSDSWGYREDMEQLSASITDVRSVADQAAATTAVADLDAADLDTEGTVWWLQSPGTLVVYTSGEFVPVAMGAAVPVSANGWTTMSGTADSTRTKTITLPTGRFTSMPAVMLQNGTGVSKASSTNQQEWTTEKTAASFQLNVNRSNATTVTINWLAVSDPTATTLLASAPAPFTGTDQPTTTATCPTDGCPNQGIAIEVTATRPDDETGAQVPVDAIECGVCGADITATAREAS